MYIWFFLLQKLRQSVDCFIYCSIYKGTDMILCCWHLLTYQKINSIGRRIKKISYDLKGSSKNNDNSQQPMSSTESLWNHLQDLTNVWRQTKWMKDKRCVFWILVLDETKPRFIALDIMITKLFYMFQSQIIPIGVQVAYLLALYPSNITQNRTSWGMFTYIDIFE